MKSSKLLFAGAALAAAALIPAGAMAARNWVLPSTAVLSGSNAWVSFDAASSDEVFIPSLRALPLTGVQVWNSEGAPAQPQNGATGRLRSSFDVQIDKPGTWKIASLSTLVNASYTEGGAVKRFRGTAEEFAKQVPAGAPDLKVIRALVRDETYVTRDAPTTTVFKTTGEGLEVSPITHPADVVAGEEASFRLLLDGKPAAGLEVTFMRGWERWDAKASEIRVKTGPDGVAKVALPKAGMWWLSTAYQTGAVARGGGGPPRRPAAPGQPAPPPPPVQPLDGDGYSAAYTMTFEVQAP